MRSFLFLPAPGGGPSRGALTTTELVLVLVIIVVAGGLAVLGMPMFGALEFIAGVLYVACRAVKALRTAARPLPPLEAV